MNLDCIIVSDFLDNPDKVRESLIEQNVEFVIESKLGFPGKRTPKADEGYQQMVNEKLEKVLPFKFEQDLDTSTFQFQLCLEGDKSWVHVDKTDWAGILYLTPDAPIDSGTVIYTEDSNGVLRDTTAKVRETGDQSLYEKLDKPETTTMIGNVYNRLLLLRGYSLPHRSDVPGFGDCLENGRLTQVFFFNEVK